MTDAVLAVEAARDLPVVDGSRIAVCGASQGGGLALAAAALAPGLTAAIADVPFLCHYRRAVEVTDELPYAEIRGFLRSHRREEAQVFRTLSLLRRALVRGPRDGAGAVLGGPRGRGHAAVDGVRRLQRVRRPQGDPRLAVQRPRCARGGHT